MLKRILLSLILLIGLCGCSSKEPNEKYMVSAIGIEEREEGVCLYYKVTDLLSSDPSGKTATMPYFATGGDVSSAAENMSLMLSAEASLSHAEILVLSPKLDGDTLKDILGFLREKEISLQMRLSVCEGISDLFSKENSLSGTDMTGMLHTTAKTHGFAGHTALFEIETAVKVNSGDFALPYFEKGEENFKITGLGIYKNCAFVQKIGVGESSDYAENKDIEKDEKLWK